jgi:hypothetical protein
MRNILMSSNIRSWLIWFIPVFVSCGMAFGALIGPSSFSNAAMKEGPAGDIAGAAGALMVTICIVVGFVMAMFTIIVARLLHRSVPDHIILRFGFSIVGGGITGALAVYVQDVSIAWFLLIGGPILLAWFCGTGKRLPAEDAFE